MYYKIDLEFNNKDDVGHDDEENKEEDFD